MRTGIAEGSGCGFAGVFSSRALTHLLALRVGITAANTNPTRQRVSIYSNVAYQLLVFIIGQVADEGYEGYMYKTIYQPMGMSCQELVSTPPDRWSKSWERVDQE